MSAADLAAIREALNRAEPYVFDAPFKGALDVHDLIRLALAALDRIEQMTLTPEEAADCLTGLRRRGRLAWFPSDVLVAKLERVAGDTGEAT